MPIRVKLPNGDIIPFPDDWSKDQISEHLSSTFGTNAPQAAAPSAVAAPAPTPDVPSGMSTMDKLNTLGQLALPVLRQGMQAMPINPASGISPEAVHETGQMFKAAGGDIAAGMRALKTGPSEASQFSGNIPAWFNRQQLPMNTAVEEAGKFEQEQGSFPWASTAGEVAGAGLEMVPKMLALRAAGGGMVRQSLMSGGIFGIGEGGEFHVKDAAIAAAFPGVGAAARYAIGKNLATWVASGMTKPLSGMSGKFIELMGENAAQMALQTAAMSPDLVKAYKEDPTKFKREIAKMTAMQLAFALHGGKSVLNKEATSFTEKFTKEMADKKAEALSDEKIAAVMEAKKNISGGREQRAQEMVKWGRAKTLDEAFEQIDAGQTQRIAPREERIAALRKGGMDEAHAEAIADRQEADFEGAAGRRAEITAQRMAPPQPAAVPAAPPAAPMAAPVPVAPLTAPVAAAPVPVAAPAVPDPAARAQQLKQIARSLDMIDNPAEFAELRKSFADDPEVSHMIDRAEHMAGVTTAGTGTTPAPTAPPAAPTPPTPEVPPVIAKPAPKPVPSSGLPSGINSRDVYKRATDKKITKQAAIAELVAEHAASAKAAIAGAGDDVELSNIDPTTNEPFARDAMGQEMAKIDQKTGKVVIDPDLLAADLEKIPVSEHEAYVKSIVGEERIHGKVLEAFGADKQAPIRFIDNMTPVERAIARKIIFGKFGQKDISQWELGHEIMRYRLQRLQKMTPKELIAISKREKWTIQSLEMVANAVRGVREFANQSGAVENMKAMDKVEANISAVAASLGAQAPPARARAVEKKAEEQTMGLPGISAPPRQLGTPGLTQRQQEMQAKVPVSPGRQEELFDKTSAALQRAHGVVADNNAAKAKQNQDLVRGIAETIMAASDVGPREAITMARQIVAERIGDIRANQRQVNQATAKFQAPLGPKESLADQMDLQEFSKGKQPSATSEWNEIDTATSPKAAAEIAQTSIEEGNNARVRKVGDSYVIEQEKILPPVAPREDAIAKENARIAKLATDLPDLLAEEPISPTDARTWISTIYKDKGEPFIERTKDGDTAVGYINTFGGKPTNIVRGRGADLQEAMQNMADYTKYLSEGKEKPDSYKVWSAKRGRAAEKAVQEEKQAKLFAPPARSRSQRELIGEENDKVIPLTPRQTDKIYNPEQVDEETGLSNVNISSKDISDVVRPAGAMQHPEEHYAKIDEELNGYYEGGKDWSELSPAAQDMVQQLKFMEGDWPSDQPEPTPINRAPPARSRRRMQREEGGEQPKMFFGDLLWSDKPKPEDIAGKPGAFEAGALKPAINKQELDQLAKDKIIEHGVGIKRGEVRKGSSLLNTISEETRVQSFKRKAGGVFKAFMKDMQDNKGLRPGEARDLWLNNLPEALLSAMGDDIATLRSRYNLGRVVGQTHTIADPLPEYVAAAKQLTLEDLAGAKTPGDVSKVLQKAIQRGSGESGKRVGAIEKLMRERKKWAKSGDPQMKKYMLDQIDARLDELAAQEGAGATAPEEGQLQFTEEASPIGKTSKIEVPRETTPQKGPKRVARDYTGMKPGQPRWKEVMDRMRVLESRVDARGNMRPVARREYESLERFAERALDYTPGASKKPPEFTPVQRYRLKVISELLTAMRAEAEPGSQESLARKTVTHDDLSAKGPDQIKQPAYRKLNQTQTDSPEWRASLVEDAREHGRPEEETKRLLVVEDRESGKVHMLSIYQSGHRGERLDLTTKLPTYTGIRVADPKGASDISLGRLLTEKVFTQGDIGPRYRPRYSVLLDEPVKNFRQNFDSISRYRGEFGNDARSNAEAAWYSGGDPETLAQMHGERGFRRGMKQVVIPIKAEGALEWPKSEMETMPSEKSMHWRKALSGAMEAGGALQAPEARAVVNEIGGMAGLEPDIKEVMDAIRSLGMSAKAERDVNYPKSKFESAYSKAPWQAISGLQKMMEREMQRDPNASQEEALYNVGFRVMRILKNPHLSEDNLMRSYGPRPDQLPPSSGDRKSTATTLEMPSREELLRIDQQRREAGLKPATTSPTVRTTPVETAPQAAPGAKPFLSKLRAKEPWWKQPANILTPEDIAQIDKEIAAEQKVESVKPAYSVEKLATKEKSFTGLGDTEIAPPARSRKTKEAIKAANKFAIYAVRNPVDAMLGAYSGWLTDNIRRKGDVNSERFASLADQQINRKKQLYGDMTPVIDIARKVAGRANKATKWMNDVKPVPGAEYAGIRNYVSGTEDNLVSPTPRQDYDRSMFPDREVGEPGPKIPTSKVEIPEYAKDEMSVMDKANRLVGKILEAVTGTPPSGKIQRNMTAVMYDIIRAGPGSKKSPNEKWHQLVEANALINGYTKNGVARLFNEWKAKLDMVHLSADGIDQVNQDFQRKMPRVVTHLKLGTGWEEMVHSSPYNYIETAAQRAASVRAFRELFPNTDEGRKLLNGLRSLAEGEMDPSGQEDLTALIRSMQGHPSDSYQSPLWARPGTFVGDVARTVNQNIMNPLAKLALTGQIYVQVPELLIGPTAQYLGYKNVARAVSAMAKDRSLYSEREKEGSVNRVMYDWSYDSSSPVRSWTRRFQNALSRGTAENLVNEMQEGLAASAAHVVAERIAGGELSSFEKRQLPMTFKAMQFTPKQVSQLMAGDPYMLDMFKRRAAAWLTSGNRAIAEGSRLGSNKLLNSVFRFMSYPMMKTNQLRQVYGNFADAMASGTSAEKLAATEQSARFLFFNTAQGLLLGATTALLTGGAASLRQKKQDLVNNPGTTLLNALGSTISGPLWMMMQGTREGGPLLGPSEQLARSFFPYSVAREFTDMAGNTGRYRNMSGFEKAGTFITARTPITKVANMALATSGLSHEDLELTAAMKALRNWKRETKNQSIYAEVGGDEDQKQFRIHMRRADVAMQKNDLGDALAEMMDAAGVKYLAGDEGIEAVKQSMGSRKQLRGLKPEEVEDLTVRIGDRAVHYLMMHDAMIDAITEAL